MPMVYVIRTPAFEFVKVGKTKRFKSRLSNIQSGCPFRLSLWCGVNTPNPDRLESELHSLLAHVHVRGEWFKPQGSDLDLILDFCEQKNKIERAARALLQA